MIMKTGFWSEWILVAISLGIIWTDEWSASAGESNSLPLKYEEPRFLTGRIYPQGENQDTNALYWFRRQATRTGDRLYVAREYVYPNGKVAARETLIYQGDNLVSYELEELQIG